MQGNGLFGHARNADTKQILAADDAVGGVELHSSRTGQMDFCPRMGRSGTVNFDAADPVQCRVVEIARHKLGRQTQAARGLHEKNGVVAATAGSLFQSLHRCLHAWIVTSLITEILTDRLGHCTKQIHDMALAAFAQETAHPIGDPAIGIGIMVYRGS